MTYIIEIELPSSGNWFKYFTGIESREEADDIKREAKGILKARVSKESPKGCQINEKGPSRDNCSNTPCSEEGNKKDTRHVSMQPKLQSDQRFY